MKFAYASGSRPIDGYTIKRGIGMGGFGEVYFATTDAGKEVALKRIQRNLDVELRGVGQCLNLKHPNLLTLFDIKHDDAGEGWIVMEYVAGESLEGVIDHHPNGMPPETVNAWLAGMGAGVACLHDHGIVHRDLKPGNIFNDAGVIKIGDYGLSKFISVSRRSGQTESVGTFHYMAPEIGRGCYGKEIDIYALGIILYEMLTGRVPFEGESSQEIIMKHLTDQPDVSVLPAAYRAVVAKALEKDPDKRYSSVTEMLGALNIAPTSPVGPMPSTPAVAAAEPAPTSAAAAEPDEAETLFIGDDEEMVFGPVEQVLQAQVVGPPRPHVEEPIARALRDGWIGLGDWFKNAGLSAPVKVILLLAAVAVVLLNAGWLVPTVVVLGLIYGIYWCIRTIVVGGAGDRPHRPARVRCDPETQPPKTAKSKAARRRRWQDLARDKLRSRPVRGRLADLLGSLLLGAVVSAVLCVVMMVLGGRSPDRSFDQWAPFYAWLTITSIAGTWTVLTLGKLWEGRRGEQVLRRFVMLAVGLALGAGAFGLGRVLLADVRYGQLLDARDMAMYAYQGAVTLRAYLLYFAGLLLALRWWRLADPLRPTRFSILGTAGYIFWAFVLDQFWPFPQPWGFMLVATISIAVQLSSPWMHPHQRLAIRKQLAHA